MVVKTDGNISININVRLCNELYGRPMKRRSRKQQFKKQQNNNMHAMDGV
jgi:hypothetical protein